MSEFNSCPEKGQKITVTFPHGAQNLLVRRFGNEYLEVPIWHGMSALNLERDLRKHLNEYPFTEEWLVDLRDFVDAKLRAMRTARKSGGFAIPLPKGRGFAIINDFPLVRGRVEVTA
ncbi:hypothetical protein [Castellaniella ginsengisoli]|uniref:Uncharacterized protein n=1 Tax=Castellaniella ginsengisoli TaxID=546114 RepID=A0AB39D7F0_9BURK